MFTCIRKLFCFFIVSAFFNQVSAQTDVTIDGLVRNYDKYRGNDDYVTVIINSLAFGDQINHTAKIKPDATFSISFPKGNPQDIMFEYRGIVTLFVKHGSHLHIEFDANDIRKSIIFSGDDSKTNSDIHHYLLEKNASNEVYKKESQVTRAEKDSSESGYKKFAFDRLRSDSLFYEAFILRNNTTEDFKTWTKFEIMYGCAGDLMQFKFAKSANKNSSPATEDYYNFFSRFPLDNPEAAMSSNYGDYISEYGKYFLELNAKSFSIPIMQIAKVLLDNLPNLTKSQQRKLNKIAGHNKPSLGDIVRLNSLRKLMEENEDLLSEKLSGQLYVLIVHHYVSKIDGFLRDVMVSNFFYNAIDNKDIEGITACLGEYKKAVVTDYLKQEILSFYQRETDKFYNTSMPLDINLVSSPKSISDSIFENIVDKYKGKVVYVDFWATWCGPCREQMPNSAKLRNDLIGKDVVFVYLGVQSIESTWKSMIAQLDMKGENYLLNASEYKGMKEKFQISGIPHYVLVDPEGKIKDGNAKSPDNIELKKEILGLLNK